MRLLPYKGPAVGIKPTEIIVKSTVYARAPRPSWHALYRVQSGVPAITVPLQW